MYKAPLEDYQFLLDRVIGFDLLMADIGNDDVNQELADAVLEEAGKLAGNAIALGHPVGATGAIIMTKLIHELHRINGRYGMATMCIGGGQGISVVIDAKP